jgi:hypothetical protein
VIGVRDLAGLADYSAGVIPPPAVLLADCAPLGEAWHCGEVTLEERTGGTPGPPLARVALADGTVLTLHSLLGSAYDLGATWEGHQLEGRGPRGILERAMIEWVARGGPGGGTLAVGAHTLSLPLGCWIARDQAACRDGSRAWFMDPAAPPLAPFGRTHLGEVPCTEGGVAKMCSVDVADRHLELWVSGQGERLGCTPGDGGGVAACEGLGWDPASIAAVLPDPANASCHLHAQRPVWTCDGATVLARPWKSTLGLPPEMPPALLQGVWVSTLGGVFRGCDGPSAVCGAVLGAWAAHPPGARQAELYGKALAVPAGCDVDAHASDGEIICEDGVKVIWGPRLPAHPPDDLPPRPCKMLGHAAQCVAVPGGASRALLEDVPGGVLCQPDWCKRLGIPVVP